MSIQAITVKRAHLVLSQTPMQQERRKHRTEKDIKELAESMVSVEQIHPIVVRPFKIRETPGLNGVTVNGKTYFSPDEIERLGRDTFEIVAGEGRYLAAEIAGIDELRAEVRELTDEQVEEIQLIENLQRTGLHELVEAEGYEALMKRGHTVDEVATRTGKSKATVYARMKLLDLCPDVRKAFREGKVTASIALLLARIPVEALQKQALAEILDESYEPMSYREASEHIQRNYMLRLKEAPFPVGDMMLLPGAGSCASCPKNTATQRELFSDVEKASAGVCTDPVCFKQKTAAATERKLAEAKASGQRIIEGKQAEKIAKYGTHSLQGFVKLDDRCYDDPKNRTYRQLLGKQVEPTVLVDPKSGQAIEVVDSKEVAPVLKAAGASSPSRSSSPEAAREKKAKQERVFRAELYTAIRPRLPEVLGRTELEHIALVFFKRLENEVQKVVCKLQGWELVSRKVHGSTMQSPDETGEQHIPKLNDAQLSAFLLDCSYAQELRVFTWSIDKPELLLAAAKRFKIDPEKIRKEIAADAKAKKKPAPAKASTQKKAAKKAGRKAK